MHVSDVQVPDEPQAWPILQCKNVFVLPGVPELFSSKLDSIATHFLEGGAPSLARRVLLAVAEDSIVHELNAVVREHSAVAFGSYPVKSTLDGRAVRTIITLEAGADAHAALEAALAALLSRLPDGAVADVEGAISDSTHLKL